MRLVELMAPGSDLVIKSYPNRNGRSHWVKVLVSTAKAIMQNLVWKPRAVLYKWSLEKRGKVTNLALAAKRRLEIK